MFKNILRNIGRALAATAHGLAKAAVYVSDHPQVVTAVANVALLAGADPTKVGNVTKGVAVVDAVTDAVKSGS